MSVHYDVLFVLCVNDLGGAELSMMNVAQGLARQGVRVAMAVYGKRCDRIPSEYEDIPLIRLNASRTVSIILPLYKILRETRPMVLISALTHTNIIAYLTGRFFSKKLKIVVTEHSQIPLFPMSGDSTQTGSFFLRWIARFVYNKTQAVVGVSRGVSSALEGMGVCPDLIHTIFNPVMVSLPCPTITPPHVWFQDLSEPVIIGVGRFGPEKNFSLLIEAFASLVAQRPARLIILGEGKERPVLSALIEKHGLQDRVLLHGFVNNVGAWLQHAAVFVCPSRIEGFGNAIVEAMAAGRSIVSTDCPYGPSEILDHGRYGHLVPMDDPEAMATAIGVALDHPTDASLLRERASLFGESPCLMAYQELIDKIVTPYDKRYSFMQRLRRRLASIFLHENWMIGIVNEPIENSVTWKKCPPVHWIGPRSTERYLADPFPFLHEADSLLCEEYRFDTKQGRILRLTLKDHSIHTESVVDFPVSGHLSYPFLFEHDGKLYALPESGEARCLALMVWQPSEKRWERFATPLLNTPAADSVLFTHEGLFWIAYTDADRDRFDNLNLLYATQLEGPWTPHKNNPVIRRSRDGARCGGTPFRIGKDLYRPAQDCADVYGKALRIKKILMCTPEAYREEDANVILPDAGINPHGLHTLSAWGDRCLVDGKRMLFSPSQVAEKIIRRFYKRA